jgi:hypothetical protein
MVLRDTAHFARHREWLARQDTVRPEGDGFTTPVD